MDGEPPQEEDFSQIPIVERSQHKNWKARLSAYTDVIAKSAKTASDTDPFFRPFVSDGALLKKWTLDANAVAQEKGIEAVLAIVQYSGESSSRTDVTPALVDKALGSVRAGTKKKGAELCCMYVEVENSGEGVVSDVMAGLDSKQPKVVAGAVACLNELISSFGVPVIGSIKPVLKVIPKIFGHTDKNVRAEGSTLVTTLYTYLGPALLPALAELKPVQMSELQKSFDSMDADGKGANTGKPTRWTRSAQRDRESAEASGGDADDAQEEEAAAPIDPRSLLDPVNVLSKFPDNLDEQLTSTKWKERLEVLEECNKVLSQPANAKISDSNIDAYGSLVSTLGTKCKSDANVNVVIEAAKVIEGLATGLGKPFGRFRSTIMPGVIERLKERKANVVDALGKALNAVFTTTTLSEIVDDVLTGCKSKNPQVREGSLKFLLRSLQTTPDAPGKDQIKPMAETLVSLLGDSLEPVRTSAAECLGTMMKILGERTFNPYVENVAELQMAKVKDAFARAEIKYKAGGSKAAPAAKPSTAAPAKKPAPSRPAVAGPGPSSRATSSPPIKASGKFGGGEMLDEFAAPPVKAPPARFARPAPAKSAPAPPPNPPVAAAKKPAPSAKAGPSKTLASSPTEPVKYRYSNDDALAQAADLIPANFQTSLADSAWKVRLEAADEMIKWVEEEGAEKVDSEIMIRFLGKTPGWNEKNFQVSAKIFKIIQMMAERSPTFGKPPAALCIGHLTDKLGDMKLKLPSGETLTAIAEKTSLAFVLAQGYEPMGKQKAPKAQADALTWIKQQINDFGIAGIPLRDLISFVKTALGSPNALVRASATQLLVTVKVFVGGDISGFLEDLNPQLLSTINSEFDKASSQTPPEPSRTQADLQEAAAGPSKGGKGGADPLDDLVPRVDLDKLVAQTSVIADSRADAWKVRKEAFEALNALLDVKSNQRLKPNMGEIGTVLRKAMADTNLSVKMLALGIISKIATGMGSAFDKYNKILAAAVASVCADQKATTRTTALATLSAMAEASGGLDSLYGGLATSCETANPVLRAAVLGWLAEKFAADPPASTSDLQPLACPVVHCLEDRNGDVRKAASAVLPFVVANAGADFVMDQTSGLKPASRATIIPLIEKARSNAPSAPAAAPGPSRAAPAKAAASSGTPVKARVPAGSRSAVNSPAAAGSRAAAAPVRSLAMKALSTAPSSRLPASHDERPSALPKPRMGLVRPASSMSSAPSASSSSAKIVPFQSDVPEPRIMRLKKDSAKWMLEPGPGPKSDLTEYLAHQMEHHASPELYTQLFSKDHRAEEDYMAALTTLSEFYDAAAASMFGISEDDVRALQLANVDLTLKYAALKLLLNNTQMANRCLDVIAHVSETVARYEERFSDIEAKLFMPALIFKLGDSKFSFRLLPIFDSLDRIFPTSQVVQLLVQYGLDDKAGKTCKNESLQLIEKAYRKRGSVLRTKDDRGFFETLAKCVSDVGTRSAALNVMALLQTQGGSKALEAVVESMPLGSRDMLANRKATMAASKAGPVSRMEQTSATPSRMKAPSAAPSSARAAGSSPALAATRQMASPATRLPRPGGGSPAVGRPGQASTSTSSGIARAAGSPAKAQPSALPRQTMQQPTSRLQKMSDPFAPAVPRASMMPLARLAAKPASSPPFDAVAAAINDIRQEDPARAVDALKHLQELLTQTPHFFEDSVHSLMDALLDEFDRAFSQPDLLHDVQHTRMVKHLMQTFSCITCNSSLIRKLDVEGLYPFLSALLRRLIQADRLGGTIAEMGKFMNLIVIQAMSTPERITVYTAMFRLVAETFKDFDVTYPGPDSEVADHAELLLKCLWKRAKVMEEDFRAGRLSVGKLLVVLEAFLEDTGPQEWSRRKKSGVFLGDMPLKTVKSFLQKAMSYTLSRGEDIYDVLLAEFGDLAADTIVYTYLFRMAAHETNGSASEIASVPESTPRPTSIKVENTETPPSEPKVESEAERLVKGLTSGNQHENLDQLYSYMKSHPEQEGEVYAVISTLPPAVQAYVKRMLDSRKTADTPSSPRNGTSPIKSPAANRPSSLPPTAGAPAKRGPRPSSLAVDKSAPAEDQLAVFKDVFKRAAQGQSHSGGEPLSEIDDPQTR